MKKNLVGNILASTIGLVIAFCVFHQFVSLSVGDMHTGGLYGGRGDAIMYSNY